MEGVVRNLFNDESFQFYKALKCLHGFVLAFSGILQICGQVVCVCKNAVLPHAFYGGNHFLLAQSEDVGKIVNP